MATLLINRGGRITGTVSAYCVIINNSAQHRLRKAVQTLEIVSRGKKKCCGKITFHFGSFPSEQYRRNVLTGWSANRQPFFIMMHDSQRALYNLYVSTK